MPLKNAIPTNAAIANMSTTTEVWTITLPEGSALEDRKDAALAVIKQCFDDLRDHESVQNVRIGAELENMEKIQVFLGESPAVDLPHWMAGHPARLEAYSDDVDWGHKHRSARIV